MIGGSVESGFMELLNADKKGAIFRKEDSPFLFRLLTNQLRDIER